MALTDVFRDERKYKYPYYRTIDLDQPFKEAKSQLEEAMLKRTMEVYQGNISHVASAMGLSRVQVYNLIDKFSFKRD